MLYLKVKTATIDALSCTCHPAEYHQPSSRVRLGVEGLSNTLFHDVTLFLDDPTINVVI